MKTRLDRIYETINGLVALGIPANQWRLDTAKKGIGFPRLYVPVAFRDAVQSTPQGGDWTRKAFETIAMAGTKYHQGYIYG